MNDKIRFLLVTANENETHALISDPAFKCEEMRSSDPRDATFYNVGTYGEYDIVHFELPDQGSVGADSSQLAINTAINEFKPDAVILVGIAFGKDNDTDQNRSQEIGTVLVSEKVADYESGKVKEKQLQSDGAIPESGRQLLSAFKHYANTWEYSIDDKRVNCEFGLLLSGDKVVDDPDFKKALFERYPRAIGGEMEGRGAYAVCRRNGIEEWIIVKAICDWGDGNKSVDKQHRQVVAAQSAVAFLNHLFTNPKSFEKIGKLGKKKNDVKEKEEVVGYFINFGITTCRLFQILKNKKGLRESKVISYDISNPKDKRYLSGIIDHVKNELFPIIRKSGNHIFFKAFADAGFSDIFRTEKERNKFISDLYSETGLYFNILTQRQTKENLQKIFRDIGNVAAIINIGSRYVEMLVYSSKKYHMYNLNISLDEVDNYTTKHGIPEIWNETNIEDIKKFIKEKIGASLKKVTAKRVVIIKNELDFMDSMGYPLKIENGNKCLTIDEYRAANRELLFSRDYRKYVDIEHNERAAEANRFYGFKNGHIILETIFDCVGTEIVIPSNELSIHGNKLAYIFNITISGSTSAGNEKYMIEASKIMKKRGLTVLSPRIINDKLEPQSIETHKRHADAIRECDLLFVSNKNGYIGEQTGREIYGAYLLSKPIAFWKEPIWSNSDNPDEFDNSRLDYIPHEQWWEFMRVLEDEDE